MGTKSRTSPEGTVVGDPGTPTSTSVDENEVIHAASESSREEKKAIGDLLVRLEAHLADEKRPISKCPGSSTTASPQTAYVPGNREQAVVFTEFADTADWLVSQSHAQGFSTKSYSGRDPHASVTRFGRVRFPTVPNPGLHRRRKRRHRPPDRPRPCQLGHSLVAGTPRTTDGTNPPSRADQRCGVVQPCRHRDSGR